MDGMHEHGDDLPLVEGLRVGNDYPCTPAINDALPRQ